MEKLKNLGSTFVRDERGGLIVFLAAVAIPLVVAIGLAVDAGRGYLVKSRLGEALDAAALAGAIAVNDAGFEDEIAMIFNANFPPGYLGANVTLAPPVVSADNELISLSAQADVQTTFMRVIGIDNMQVSTASEVTRRTVSLDVSLSMDMSGSMGWSDGAGSTRIAGARAAATTLIDVLYGPDETKENLKIGLMPWNSKVNVTDGSNFISGLTQAVTVDTFTNPIDGLAQSEVYYANNSDVPFLSPPHPSWKGCVYARYLDDGLDDNDADFLLGPVQAGGVDWPAWEPIGPGGEPAANGGNCANTGNGSPCRPCQSVGITRLSNTKTTIQDAIDDLTNPNGRTNIVQGLAWAYRGVSPGEPFDDAAVDTEGNHVRAIILLTDGEHTGDDGDAYKGAFGEDLPAGANGLDQRLRDLADYIKSQGITIYTIQYFHDSGPLADLMQYVATEPNPPYYHFAPDSDTLDTVFEEVANHLTDLRLSK